MTDHPARLAQIEELHARPFPALSVPGRAIYLALKEQGQAAARDRGRDRAQLADLCARLGLPEPGPRAAHGVMALGTGELKWESHSEFASYAAFLPGAGPLVAEPVFPEAWRAAHPARRIAALGIAVEPLPESPEAVAARIAALVAAEGVAVAAVLDGQALVAGDFRPDAAGLMRFAVLVRPGTEPRRVGRIVQTLAEIEIYRAMSMLGLGRARDLTAELDRLSPRLAALIADLAAEEEPAETRLHELLDLTAELEGQAARISFRFGATAAYEALVAQRLALLREAPVEGRPTLGDFLARRYDPAMRTVRSAERRLQEMIGRATRAADLLRTRVEVARSAQNQRLLESMDRRADLALRLQHTVEGLSVVAIGYYAVSLATYALLPFAEALHWPKSVLTAVLVPLVLGAAWLGLRRLKQGIGH